MMARSSARRSSKGGAAVEDDDQDFFRQKLSTPPSKSRHNDDRKDPNSKAKRSAGLSFYPAIIVGAMAYYIGYLQGKIERYNLDNNHVDDDIVDEPYTTSSQQHNLRTGGGMYPVFQSESQQHVSVIEEKDEDNMLLSVTTLRCLTTPGCYPKAPCRLPKRQPTKLPVTRHWEEHSLCAHDLLQYDDVMPCVVYSFGLYDSIEWESKMHQVFGCEVFAFDPTSKFNSTPAEGVHFYKLGLKGGGVYSGLNAHEYKSIDPSSLYTLGEIINLLGHQKRKIDVLRLDCEGCEYGVLNQLACGDSKGNTYDHLVNQLMVEFHFAESLGLANDDDIRMGAKALQCLEKNRWGLVSLEESGIDPGNAKYTDSALRVIKDPFFALYATFRRIPPNELLPWQVYKDAMDASWDKEKVFKKYSPKYGGDSQNWPDRAKAEWDRIDSIFKEKIFEYTALYRGELVFDTFQRFDSFQRFEDWEKLKKADRQP